MTYPNTVISMPSQLFTMRSSFKAMANGNVYVGAVDTDPTIPTNQIQVYIEQENGTLVPVAQPIKINSAGLLTYSGQVQKFVLTNTEYSMAVLNAYGVQEHYFPRVYDQGISAALEVERRDSGFGSSVYYGSNGKSVKVGDEIPVGTTHIIIEIDEQTEKLVAWDTLTLPAVITTVPTADNGFKEYEVITDQGTFKFVTKETELLRGRVGYPAAKIVAYLSGWATPGEVSGAQINAAIRYCYDNRIELSDGGGTYLIDKDNPIRWIGGDQYFDKGTVFRGAGKGKTIFKTVGLSDSREDFVVGYTKDAGTYSTIWNVDVSDFTIEISDPDDGVGGWSGIGHYGAVSRFSTKRIDVIGPEGAINAWRGWWFDIPYVYSADDCLFYAKNRGFTIWQEGTTGSIDNIGVFGCEGTAYKLTGNYSSVGNIFAEDCSNVGFEFDYFSGTVGTLGCENPNTNKLQKTVKFNASNVDIGNIYHQDVDTTDADYRVLTLRTGSLVKINSVRVKDDTNIGVTVAGNFLDQFDGELSLGHISSDVIFPYGTDSRANSASLELNPKNSTSISFARGNRRPFIGAQGEYWNGLDGDLGIYGGVVKAIYLDAYGSHRAGGASGGTNYQFTIAPEVGDLFLENDPATNNAAGYICTSKGADTNGSNSAVIPILVGGSTANRPTGTGRHLYMRYFDTDLNKPVWWNGSNWRDASGVVA